MDQEPLTAPLDFDPALLMTFLEVARAGSISAAARRLGWTSQALGQRLTRLEKQLNVSLVSRHVDGVRLTPVGELLVQHAEAIHGRLSVARAAILDAKRKQSSKLNVAVSARVIAGLVAPIIPQMVALNRNTKITLNAMESPYAFTALLDGQVDCALLITGEDFRASSDSAKQLRRLPIAEMDLELSISREHELAQRADRVFSARDFAEESWVCVDQHEQERLQAYAKKQGFTPENIHIVGDQGALQEMVAGGAAVALTSWFTFHPYRSERITSISLEEPPRESLGMWIRRADSREIIQDFGSRLRMASVKSL